MPTQRKARFGFAKLIVNDEEKLAGYYRREVAKADMKAKEAPEETTRGKSRKAK